MELPIRHGRPALVLAPMEGVTDAPMRALLTELPGFTHCVTEFLRISQQALPLKCYPRHAGELKTNSRTGAGVPVIFQLLGGNAERLALSAKFACEAGAQGIDLNFGCPAPTVNNHDGGAAILRCPERVEEIVKAVREAVPAHLPVSAKLRLGWDDPNAIFENAARAERGGASWITIHGRTKTQGYRPPAYWEPIAAVARQVSIPVIANGEIWDLDDFKRCRDITRGEHFMIGRGALANPHLAAQIAAELGIPTAKGVSPFPTEQEWRDLLSRFVEISAPLSDNPNYCLRRVKQWMRYVDSRKPFQDFQELKRMERIEDFTAALPRLNFPELLPA
ncbi:MAG: tRNA-dihydrouridine synthase family protein [Proteobacteria bacterium]|nr:MAG: tRNA-dihydrouridine synthase family protein [Pseudomonadota bacterium]